jgi:dnd system-associated protein 4
MAVNRIRIAKDKAELVKSLVNSKETTGAFQTYADVMIFAASLGAKAKKRLPLPEIAKEPAPISLEIFISRGYDWVIKLLAIAATDDPKIIAIDDRDAEEKRSLIFEEYANAGLEQLRDELRGAVDYTERLLLILNSERFPQQSSEDEFDLSRFL